MTVNTSNMSVIGRFAAPAPLYAALTVVLICLMPPTLFAMMLDERLHNGINIWIKPLKFQVALIIYTASLVIFANWLPQKTKAALWFKIFSIIVFISIIYEILWISGAAAFGTQSHFNTSTPFMGTLYGIAGLGAVILTSASLVFGVIIARDKQTTLSPPMHLAIWLSLVVTAILTIIVASYMSSQTSHFVDGDMLDTQSYPIMGWAKDGGDLRIAHFFATHVMHIIPLLVWGLISLGIKVSKNAVIASMIIYIAFTIFTLFEAINGISFLGTFVS